MGFFFRLALVGFVFLTSSADAGTRVVLASWYGGYFHGRTMANGDPFDENNPENAASLMFPLGTRVTLCNIKETSEQVCLEVTIQDRISPRYRNRIDLSKAAAEELNFKEKGVTRLQIVSIVLP